jgi:type IV pilus assembly protein PilX
MSIFTNHPHHALRQQHGSVLITALIFLMILTMIVLSMLSGGTLEERMAANEHNRSIALQAADAVLRDAEANILNVAPLYGYVPARFNINCDDATSPGFCATLPITAQPRWSTWTPAQWTNAANTRTFANNTSNLLGVPAQPTYIVELVRAPGGENVLYINITARGVGQNDAVAFVQGSYKIPQP